MGSKEKVTVEDTSGRGQASRGHILRCEIMFNQLHLPIRL